MEKKINDLALFGLVLAILINCGCPAIFGYNIIGNWWVTVAYTVGGEDSWDVTFSGDRNSGSCTLTGGGVTIAGTYTVTGKDVDIEFTASDGLIVFTGSFESRNAMSGNGTLLLYSPSSPLFSKLMNRQARSALKSESYPFTWYGEKY
ncbi:MAG: hypothetical protein PVI11_05475 [Candidatus Aminicenantes bacterium]|jgi:hypothetical protein